MSDFDSTLQKEGIFYSQDYNLINLLVLSPTMGAIDIKNSMIEISYYEDIFSSVVSGSLVVSEALGLVEKMNLTGNEYIRLTFNKAAGKATAIDKLFRIYKISSRQLIGNVTTEGYIIHFCSDELLLSQQYNVSKSYKGKKVSDIVEDITKNYLKIPDNKTVVIENTMGVYDFIVPMLKPLEAINWVSSFGRPGNGTSVGCDMIFFENRYGYKFSSLQTLFQQTPIKTYSYQPKNIDSAYQTQNQEIYNVISYQFVNTFDTLDAINRGQFANRLISVDPITRTYNTTDFNYKNYHDKADTINKHSIINDVKNRFGHAIYETPEAMVRLSVTNSNQKNVDYITSKPNSVSKDVFIETVLPNRMSQLSISNYNKLKLFINGDPNATAGLTINFDLLTLTPSNQGKKPDKFFSGKYLISAAKHTINQSGYVSTIEIIKDSVPNEYNVTNIEANIWKNTVKGII